jgi:shikimate kinase
MLLRDDIMAVLGSGNANGGCSLLHAAGLGYGASIGLDLPLAVRLLDRASKRDVDDPDELLPAVVDAWLAGGFKLPNDLTKEELHWAVISQIPPRQGLKSSAATAIGALRALADATKSEVSDEEYVAMASQAQIEANVSLTGSVDDAWACLTPGWKLVDPQANSIAEGILFEGDGPNMEHWLVMIVCRGEREKRPELEDFIPHQNSFQNSLEALQEMNELVALTWNGRGIVAVMNDVQGRKITNDAMLNGARAAGMSGSGNAIIVVAPKVSVPSCDRLRKLFEANKGVVKVIETSFLSIEKQETS